jgi:hypothetical protein
MTLLMHTAVARRLKRIIGDVLSINVPMPAFVTALDFGTTCRRRRRRSGEWSGGSMAKAPDDDRLSTLRT